jgi:hypothetical protein
VPHTAAKCPIWRAAESVCAQAGLTLVVFSGTEAKPELQVVGRRPVSVRGAVGGVKRGEVCRQELVLRVGGKRENVRCVKMNICVCVRLRICVSIDC